jgi:hypothetical protein
LALLSSIQGLGGIPRFGESSGVVSSFPRDGLGRRRPGPSAVGVSVIPDGRSWTDFRRGQAKKSGFNFGFDPLRENVSIALHTFIINQS